jgi:hypothetical protein
MKVVHGATFQNTVTFMTESHCSLGHLETSVSALLAGTWPCFVCFHYKRKMPRVQQTVSFHTLTNAFIIQKTPVNISRSLHYSFIGSPRVCGPAIDQVTRSLPNQNSFSRLINTFLLLVGPNDRYRKTTRNTNFIRL